MMTGPYGGGARCPCRSADLGSCGKDQRRLATFPGYRFQSRIDADGHTARTDCRSGFHRSGVPLCPDTHQLVRGRGAGAVCLGGLSGRQPGSAATPASGHQRVGRCAAEKPARMDRHWPALIDRDLFGFHHLLRNKALYSQLRSKIDQFSTELFLCHAAAPVGCMLMLITTIHQICIDLKSMYAKQAPIDHLFVDISDAALAQHADRLCHRHTRQPVLHCRTQPDVPDCGSKNDRRDPVLPLAGGPVFYPGGPPHQCIGRDRTPRGFCRCSDGPHRRRHCPGVRSC